MRPLNRSPIPAVGCGKVYGPLHDARGARVGQGVDVSEFPTRLHVDIELEAGSDPICGWVGFAGHGGREFRGWIELAAALEAIRSAPIVAPGVEDYASADGS